MTTFAQRLAASWDSYGHLCVGIDPHTYLLDSWGLPDTAAGAREMALRVIDACAGTVGVVKPQVSFFERFGSTGFSVLENIVKRARDAGILVVADAKRGDIGSTMDGYAQAWLHPSSPLAADAVTVTPYLGVDSLEPVFAVSEAHNGGAFVLAVTSNPEAVNLQTSTSLETGVSVSAAVVSGIQARRKATLSSVGVVIGAEIELGMYGLTPDDLIGLPILAPGFGAQGAQVRDARSRFGPASAQLLVAQSRSILEAGPQGILEAVRRQAGEVADALG